MFVQVPSVSEAARIDRYAIDELHTHTRVVEPLDATDLGRIEQDALGKQKSANEIHVMSRRAHRYRERRFSQPNLERILDCYQVVDTVGTVHADSRHLYGGAVGRVVALTHRLPGIGHRSYRFRSR